VFCCREVSEDVGACRGGGDAPPCSSVAGSVAHHLSQLAGSRSVGKSHGAERGCLRLPLDAYEGVVVEPGASCTRHTMLDHKRSWDELVLRHAPHDERHLLPILDNQLYHNVTTESCKPDYIAMGASTTSMRGLTTSS